MNYKEMKIQLLSMIEDISQDLLKDNSSAAQRVRVKTVAFEKLAKDFRRESIDFFNSKKVPKKKAAKKPVAKKAIKSKFKKEEPTKVVKKNTVVKKEVKKPSKKV